LLFGVFFYCITAIPKFRCHRKTIAGNAAVFARRSPIKKCWKLYAVMQ